MNEGDGMGRYPFLLADEAEVFGRRRLDGKVFLVESGGHDERTT